MCIRDRDKVEGLDAGANDYLAKPFHLAELEARIRSLALRQFTQQGDVYKRQEWHSPGPSEPCT